MTGQNVLVDRITEQRNHWKDMAKLYKARLDATEAIIIGIDRRMGHGWTRKLADALTARETEVKP